LIWPIRRRTHGRRQARPAVPRELLRLTDRSKWAGSWVKQSGWIFLKHEMQSNCVTHQQLILKS
jgi:hypothetical protein